MSELFKTGVTEKELNGLRRSKSARAIIDCTKNIVEQNQFNVGDVLVVKRRSDGYIVKMTGDMPQKYLVVHKDEANIIYCKKVLMSGKIGVGLELPCTWNHSSYVFQLDEDLAEHMILDAVDQYDPLTQAREFRKFRDRNKRYNDKIKIKITRGNYGEVSAFLKQLTVGTTFWSMNGHSDINPTKYTVVSNQEIPIDTSPHSYMRNQIIDHELKNAGLQTKIVVEAKSASGKIDKISMNDCWWRNFYLQEPKTNKMNEL